MLTAIVMIGLLTTCCLIRKKYNNFNRNKLMNNLREIRDHERKYQKYLIKKHYKEILK